MDTGGGGGDGDDGGRNGAGGERGCGAFSLEEVPVLMVEGGGLGWWLG